MHSAEDTPRRQAAIAEAAILQCSSINTDWTQPLHNLLELQ
jgi:hypothetical protein